MSIKPQAKSGGIIFRQPGQPRKVPLREKRVSKPKSLEREGEAKEE